jgi:hypothetical protein
MDPVSLAAAAVALVGPFLLGLGKTAAEEGAKSAGKSAWEWITGRLSSGGAKEAVDDFKKDPEAKENQQALEAALVKALKKDPDAVSALQALLPASAISGGQTANVTGDNNKTGQGDRGSTVIIS